MRKLILCMTAICAFNITVGGQGSQGGPELPTLHLIKDVTLSPSYSCRSTAEPFEGYGDTALFLTDYARRRNSPDLLFDGACRSEDYFVSATAGDDMSLIADLGANVTLEELSASKVFNLRRVHSFSAYTSFARVAKVVAGHTYAVLLSERDKRGLFVFTVTEHVQNEKVSLQYAVKSYQVMPHGQLSAPGFDWEEKNSR